MLFCCVQLIVHFAIALFNGNPTSLSGYTSSVCSCVHHYELSSSSHLAAAEPPAAMDLTQHNRTRLKVVSLAVAAATAVVTVAAAAAVAAAVTAVVASAAAVVVTAAVSVAAP